MRDFFDILKSIWSYDYKDRPNFSKVVEGVQKIYNFVGKERENKLVNFEIKTHEGVIYLEHLGNYAVWADVSKFSSLITLFHII